MRGLLALSLCAWAACASPAAGTRSDLGGADGARDMAGAQCLGTADSCGTGCAVCPGSDSATTMRICTSPDPTGICDLVCKGDNYDFDGVIDNGCEANDPRHDTIPVAIQVTLPDYAAVGTVPACDNANDPCNELEEIYGDTRNHDTTPTSRPNGLVDLFQVTATGAGSGSGMKACLGISNFPVDNRYMVCISNAGSTNPADHCATMQAVGGGASVCVPSTGTLAATGTFYVSVRRLAGSNTANKYALYLQH